jgi:type VI secretion system protein ImpB
MGAIGGAGRGRSAELLETEMAESVHDKLKRVRKPRVHITYDVDTGTAVEQKELPFVVGVLGDFSGNPLPDPSRPQPRLSDRKFVKIDRANFDDVMSRIRPELNFQVANKLDKTGKTEMPVRLAFESMKDFEPAAVARQVPALKALLDARENIRELLSRAEQSEKLEGLLEQVLASTDSVAAIKSQLGTAGNSGAKDGE